MKIPTRRLVGWLLLCLALAACQKTATVSGPAGRNGPNVLRFDVAAPFISLDPAEGDASGATMIFPLLYSYLAVPDENGRLQPDLAESWTYDAGDLTWTIRLRDNAFFHDGRPVTAEDLCFSFQSVLKNIQPILMESIESLQIISDHVLAVQLKRHDPAFIRKIWALEVLPCRDPDTGGRYPPIGSGPFAFASQEGEQKIVLIANENYYKGRPAIDGVIFYYQPDQEKTWTRLLSGTTDIAREISPKNFEITRQYQDRFYFYHYTLEYYSILLYNTADPLFADPAVRRALTLAIDRRYIVDYILNGYGREAIGPMGLDSPFSDPGLAPLAYDPETALAGLRAAGWTRDGRGRLLDKDGRPFAFTLLISDETQVEKNVARYIQLCFNDIGIRMAVRSRPYKEIVARYYNNNDFQAILTEFPGAGRQPEYAIKGWIPDDQGQTLAGNFSDPQVTDLIERGLRAADRRTAALYFRQAEARLIALQPGSFLYHKTALDVMSRRFSLSAPFSLTCEGLFRLGQAAPARP